MQEKRVVYLDDFLGGGWGLGLGLGRGCQTHKKAEGLRR